MAYKLPAQSESAPTPQGVIAPSRGRGRPRIHNDPTLTVNFRVPETWRVEGSAKAKQGKVNLSKLFAIYYREFLTRPIRDTQEFIRKWEEVNGPVTALEDNP